MDSRFVVLDARKKSAEIANIDFEEKFDIDISLENLSIIQKILDDLGVVNFIFFGTLLGAVREKNLIKHDEDTDIAALDIPNKTIEAFINRCKQQKFIMIRQAEIISLARKGQYTDIYNFKLIDNLRWVCLGYEFDDCLMRQDKTTTILGYKLNLPINSEDLLVIKYGKNWKIPIKNFHAKPSFSLINTFHIFFQKYFPYFYPFIDKVYRKVKTKIKNNKLLFNIISTIVK